MTGNRYQRIQQSGVIVRSLNLCSQLPDLTCYLKLCSPLPDSVGYLNPLSVTYPGLETETGQSLFYKFHR
jgi:hypothetical protein